MISQQAIRHGNPECCTEEGKYPSLDDRSLISRQSSHSTWYIDILKHLFHNITVIDSRNIRSRKSLKFSLVVSLLYESELRIS